MEGLQETVCSNAIVSRTYCVTEEHSLITAVIYIEMLKSKIAHCAPG